ncbi:putative sugar kinase YdjH [Polystyrenella longa]|uniref:Putative sugar kinase YdjH n=2 Tax=Polystyrenella longa TaxID=2528007 RepID=A0A518CN75_9PLAN|nr:putative sugar kinase YdjH [Polystyrenella longa]
MDEPPIDCLCAGIIVSDHVCEPIPYMPKQGELILTPRTQLAVGGCASNVAVDMARLNRNVAILGRIGHDIFGQHLKQELSRQNVVCDYLSESTTSQTATTLIVNVKGEDRRFIHSVGANGEFDGREITPELISQSKILYLGGYLLPPSLSQKNVIDIFKVARAAGVTTVLDVVTPTQKDYWHDIKKALPYTDYFMPNDDEAELLTGLSDPVEQARKLRNAGAGTVLITCGDKGTVVISDKEEFRTNCFRVPFVDGTGSGDAFVAGFMHGLLGKKTLLDCVIRGSALGASAVRAVGATTSVFTGEELEDYLGQQTLEVLPL